MSEGIADPRVFFEDVFCGLAEIYGYRAALQKASVGYRLLPRFWGKGIASGLLALLVEYLFGETDVRVITASTIPQNSASAKVLQKNGFRCALRSVPEDWGHGHPTRADRWIKTAMGYHRDYKIHTNP